MGADYSFYVKSIATYAPAFLRHNNSVLARVLLLAQYWKLSKNGTLVNKSGKWQHSSIKWSMPRMNEEGKIMDSSSGRVLGLVDDFGFILPNETMVTLDERFDGLLTDGWFLIRHSVSNKVLTAMSQTTTSITGTQYVHYRYTLQMFFFLQNIFMNLFLS